MSETMICPHARREAIAAYLELPDTAAITDLHESVLPRPNSDEALALDAKIKPVYYGILGHAIRYIINAATATPISGDETVKDFPDLLDSSFRHLKDTVNIFYNDESQFDIRAQAGKLQGIRSYLQPITFPTLKQSLQGGTGTAAAASVMLLEDYASALPRLKIPGDARAVLRKSYGPLIEIASCNSKQLFMIDELQQAKRMPPVEYSPDSNIVRYSHSPLHTPVNDRMRARFERMTGGRTHADYPSEITTMTPVIGCPILLKPKQLQQFWNWTIDQAIDRGLV